MSGMEGVVLRLERGSDGAGFSVEELLTLFEPLAVRMIAS